MIHIRDLFRLQGVSTLRLVAGQSGLQRPIRTAVLFEYNEERMKLSDFYRGDLVLSTLAYAREDPELVTSSLLSLIRQGVCGLMIKTGYYAELPQPVLQEADRTGTPVFLFDDSYIEEVLLEVMGLIRNRRHFSGYEKDIDDLMRGTQSSDEVRACMRRIDPGWSGPARVYSISAPKMQELSEQLYGLTEENDVGCVFMSWRSLLLAIVHRKDSESAAPGNEFQPLEFLLREAGADPAQVVLGVGEECPVPERMGYALSEAVYTARAAEITGARRLRSSEMGIYAYLVPMSRNAFTVEYCRSMMERLREYDRHNSAGIEQTACEYIRQGRQIPATAKALFQHPNTVRYRLGKIRKIMGIEDEMTFEIMLEYTVRLSGILNESMRE